jgi:hypothetical protein
VSWREPTSQLSVQTDEEFSDSSAPRFWIGAGKSISGRLLSIIDVLIFEKPKIAGFFSNAQPSTRKNDPLRAQILRLE